MAPIYATHPSLYQRELIPGRARAILDRSWNRNRIVLPSLRIFRARNVYVACEGLVFTQAGQLITQTKTAHSDLDIDGSYNELTELLATGGVIEAHKKGVLCKKRGAENYGHWLVEMLPRAYWARKITSLNDWPIVFHKTADPLRSVMSQSLAAIGIPVADFLETDRSPVFFEELLLVEGLTSHSVFISPLVMQCMDEIAAKVGSNAVASETPDSLYAVRRPAKSRDFEDQAAAGEILLANGYSEIETGNMPFLEQVRAFKSARRVVGPMGASLTNIIFCNPGTEILVFMPASALELFYWHISEGRKLSYHEVRCEEAGEQIGSLTWNRPLRISGQAIKAVLARLKDLKLAAHLPLHTGKAWPMAIGLTAAEICDATWDWQFSTQDHAISGVRFERDGTINGYSHANEKAWRFSQDIFEIITSDGKCTWRFEQIAMTENKFVLQARFQLPHPDVITLTLRQR